MFFLITFVKTMVLFILFLHVICIIYMHSLYNRSKGSSVCAMKVPDYRFY